MPHKMALATSVLQKDGSDKSAVQVSVQHWQFYTTKIFKIRPKKVSKDTLSKRMENSINLVTAVTASIHRLHVSFMQNLSNLNKVMNHTPPPEGSNFGWNFHLPQTSPNWIFIPKRGAMLVS